MGELKKKKKFMRNIFFFPPNNVCLREDDIYSMVQYLNGMFFSRNLISFLDLNFYLFIYFFENKKFQSFIKM